MPLYDYKCTQCGKIVEVRHGFDESHNGSCPSCGAALQRIFNPAPIVFKGSGFYVTDSRTSTRSHESASGATKNDDTAKPETAKTDGAKTDTAKTEGKTASSESKGASESAA